jgi:hypothetical protein
MARVPAACAARIFEAKRSAFASVSKDRRTRFPVAVIDDGIETTQRSPHCMGWKSGLLGIGFLCHYCHNVIKRDKRDGFKTTGNGGDLGAAGRIRTDDLLITKKGFGY